MVAGLVGAVDGLQLIVETLRSLEMINDDLPYAPHLILRCSL